MCMCVYLWDYVSSWIHMRPSMYLRYVHTVYAYKYICLNVWVYNRANVYGRVIVLLCIYLCICMHFSSCMFDCVCALSCAFSLAFVGGSYVQISLCIGECSYPCVSVYMFISFFFIRVYKFVYGCEGQGVRFICSCPYVFMYLYWGYMGVRLRLCLGVSLDLCLCLYVSNSVSACMCVCVLVRMSVSE